MFITRSEQRGAAGLDSRSLQYRVAAAVTNGETTQKILDALDIPGLPLYIMHREDGNTQFVQHDRAVLSKPTQSANRACLPRDLLVAGGEQEEFNVPTLSSFCRATSSFCARLRSVTS